MKRRTSELESIVLGIVWKEGACTPHTIRTHFVTSRNSRFSGSAGAIYPLVARMERRGLLRSRDGRTSRQRKRLYEVTEGGIAHLRVWLSSLFEGAEHSTLHDPVRLRLYFIGALPPSGRQAFLRSAEAEINAELEYLKQELDRYESMSWQHSVYAIEGAQAVARARLRWVRSLARRVL